MFKFKNQKLRIQFEEYRNGSLCITLLEKNGEEYLTISTNLENKLQDKEHIFVKIGSEEQDISEAMANQGLLEVLSKEESSGYNRYRLYRVCSSCFNLAEK